MACGNGANMSCPRNYQNVALAWREGVAKLSLSRINRTLVAWRWRHVAR